MPTWKITASFAIERGPEHASTFEAQSEALVEAEAKALQALFPRYVKLTLRKEAEGSSVRFSVTGGSDKVTGGTNETGQKRLRKFMEIAQANGHAVEFKAFAKNSYKSLVEALEGFGVEEPQAAPEEPLSEPQTKPQGMAVGYARTSTLDQKASVEAQVRDLTRAGCEKVFQEQVSSVDVKNRERLAQALDFVREGDSLVVTKLDRLARSVAHLMEITGQLERKGVSLRVLDLGIDTSTPTGRLMLTLLGGIAQFEREIMLERQREGIAKARQEGRYQGRKPTARAKTAEVLALHAEGRKPAEIVRETGISRASVYRILANENGSH